MSFAVEDFVERCRAAIREPDAPQRIGAILRQVIVDPDAIAAAIAERQSRQSSPTMADVFVNSDEMTIYDVMFPANLFGVPHDHAGWAVIGVYRGAEAFNVYEEQGGRLVQRDREVMQVPAVAILPKDLIHDIDNPLAQSSGSITSIATVTLTSRSADMARRVGRGGAVHVGTVIRLWR